MTTPLLAPLALTPLPLGSVRPRGWLRRQLRIQADGLSGHLDEFWPDIADSGWIGGQAEGWERGPYWLDGLVPLAFLLGDQTLKAKVRRWLDYILAHQHDDGWLGPARARGDRYQAYDPWPVFVALKAMTQYHDATAAPRVVPAMLKFCRRLDALLGEKPLSSWGSFRWADLVLSLHWLFERTGEAWLLGLAAKAHAQGYDWRAHFANFQFTGKMAREDCELKTHVVNNAMAVKQPAVWWRQSHDSADLAATQQIIATLDRYHGQASGVFTGDEHYAGLSPSQGTELCAVVEYMFSLEVLLSMDNDVALGDRLERLAFNALPATFKPDMWAHQYDQQANQVVCQVAEDRVYTNNGPDANVFGLEPNFGCCTANMHQGWPKFASSLWRRFGDRGLFAVAHAPCEVEADVAGTHVRIEVETEYPFGDTLHYWVLAERPARFQLGLRVPAWAAGAELRVAGESSDAQPGFFNVVQRKWAQCTEVTLRLPMTARAETRFNNSVSITRGPLVYALKVGEQWRQIKGEPPHADWEVHPTTAWNYALDVDRAAPEKSLQFESRPVGECPFSPEGAPVVAHAKGRRVPAWGIEHHAAAPPPSSPVATTEPLEDLELIPYGCTNLRVTELPTV